MSAGNDFTEDPEAVKVADDFISLMNTLIYEYYRTIHQFQQDFVSMYRSSAELVIGS